jgi:site-specific recombinase XerD
MSKKPISPLRQRLIDDMTARRFSEDTKRDYVRNVRKFAAFLGRSPDTATSEDLRRFQLHVAQQQVSPWSINAAIAALRFFFTQTLERPALVRPLRIVNEPRKAPVVLTQEEVSTMSVRMSVVVMFTLPVLSLVDLAFRRRIGSVPPAGEQRGVFTRFFLPAEMARARNEIDLGVG